jgi:hypothetical protein
MHHMVRRLYVDGPAAGFVSRAPPVVNDQANGRATTLLAFWVPWGMS